MRVEIAASDAVDGCHLLQGVGVCGLRFAVWGLELKVWGLEFWVETFGFNVEG